MSKIFFKVNNKKQDDEPKKTETPEPAKTAEEEVAVSDAQVAAPEVKHEPVQIALFPGDEEKPAAKAEIAATGNQPFDKQKLVKYFKKHPKKAVTAKVERYSPKLNKGLTAQQVETRFKQFQFNDTNKKYSRSYASIFIGNICTFFNLLCLIAAIALLIANTQGLSNYMVVAITTANIVIGIIQEIRSKLSIDKLSILANNTVKVVRDGEVVEISVQELVLDDVILLDLGSQVPADVILAEGSVEVNESLLTGESIAIKKQVGDLLYAGSFISSGNGKFRVEKVGKETYLEKLTSKAKKYKRPNSELMNSTKLIIKCVSMLIIPIAIGTFLTTLHHIDYDSEMYKNVVEAGGTVIKNPDVNYAIQRTCTVVIGMIPSGMLLLTSIALAVGIVRLAKSQTLVQDMYSLEMLARVNVLCLDKTGTITDGRMRVNDTVILNTAGELSLNDIMGSMLRELDGNNQTSIALYNHFGYNDKLAATAKIPFSSKRKLSAVTFDEAGTYAMGAPEFVLKPYPAKVEKIVKQYAQMGLRVIVLAHSPAPIVGDKLPAVMKPIAIISIADNVREDAVETIKWFKDNDVNVKVISGDNPITVSEVAKRAGIAQADKFISLDGLNEKEVENVANKYTVFGRVSPEQKAILVRSIKAQGNTVAMTGDGVNDILALKEADCAISVASGSEAARNVSHLVLMDNNFNSMPKVVAEGRRVINNIKNSSALYLMKTLFTAILAFLCICMGQPYLFMPQNMLLLETAIIAAPSFFLSLQPNKDRVQGKFITHVMSGAISGAVLMIICVMAMYLTNTIQPEEFGNHYLPMCMIAMTFSGFVMVFRLCQPFNVFRATLCLAVFAICITCYAVPYIADNLLYKGWSDIKWDYAKILTIVVAIEAAFPLSSWLIELMHVIMPSTGKKQQKQQG
ncbi:MAG: HAD-IC family P-type ATPase [Clostridia bacterium]|jgi:cation-transporting ATPase E|nr:HAD-IC family P-type ATPase [Clostridia bacterium]